MRGKITIVTILLVAIALAIFAWWWRATGQVRMRAFWGQTAQQVIHSPTKVVVFRFEPAFSNVDDLGHRLSATAPHERADLSRAPGLIHAKHSLLEEASYDWDRPADVGDAMWEYAVRFERGAEQVTLLFDLAHSQVYYVEARRAASLIEDTSHDWRDYLARRAFPGAALPANSGTRESQ